MMDLEMDVDADMDSTEFSKYVADRMQQLELKNNLLEKQYQKVETEKQLAEDQRLKYERELRKLRSELDKLKTTPQLVGTLVNILEEGKSIVRSSTGPEFIVGSSQFIKDGDLKPGVQVALNKEHLSIVAVIPRLEDPLVQAMEVIESPDIDYDQIGGLDKQIEVLKGAVEFALTKPEIFERIGIDPPKGVLLFGPPGTGKTLLAKAVATRTEATFIRVVGSELVQKYIGEGARMVRDVFEMARKKAPAIIFIDELDSIGAVRLDDASSGGREVQRTLMQLLSEMDGFNSRGDVCILAATNRWDILDPALIRAGRFDRLVYVPIPDREARVKILLIHTEKMRLADDIDFDRIVALTEDANGATLRAIAMEAGMCAVREEADAVHQKDFEDAIKHIMNPEGMVDRYSEGMFA
ncbi:MAG: proteasome-activating nucleotidase [Methanosarcinales archaeon]|nr:proteasome-activating nucleotidase [Methanosarcinales archaeon]